MAKNLVGYQNPGIVPLEGHSKSGAGREANVGNPPNESAQLHPSFFFFFFSR
jgi:hypothetical protein